MDARLNHNPDLRQSLLFPFIIVGALEILFVTVLAISVTNPGAAGGVAGIEILVGLTVGWSLFAFALIWGGYRSYRRATPDWIRIDPDGVVGIFGKHFVGRKDGDVLTIPFSGISECREARSGPRGGLSPPMIRAENIGLKNYDPKSVGELIHGPPTPKGETRAFQVTKENLEAVRVAWVAWQSHHAAPAVSVVSPSEEPLPS